MKTREEILEFCTKLREKRILEDCGNTIITFKNNNVIIEFEDMYELDSLSFECLTEFSKFFNTLKLSTDEWVSSKGCSTCGYGGSRSRELTIILD